MWSRFKERDLPGGCLRGYEAEGVTRGVGVDARPMRWLVVELRPAQGEHGSFGRVKVVDPEV